MIKRVNDRLLEIFAQSIVHQNCKATEMEIV